MSQVVQKMYENRMENFRRQHYTDAQTAHVPLGRFRRGTAL